MILSIVLSFVFFCLACIHFNWVIGGKYGFEAVIPTNENGERVFHPKKTDSAIVALALTLCSIFYFLYSGITNYELPQWISQYMKWIIPSICILRAIGDFKYVGFFKRYTKTKFGKLDIIFFSPLCLIIGIIGILLAL